MFSTYVSTDERGSPLAIGHVTAEIDSHLNVKLFGAAAVGSVRQPTAY
jgi:hypothetical protein